MRIKKRLQINIAVSLLAVFVVCLTLFSSLYQLNKTNNSAKISGDIISSALERVTFRNDYVRNNSARAKEQWFARHRQIGGLLTSAADNFRDPGDVKNIAELIENQTSIGKIFTAIVANRDKRNVNAVAADLAQEVEERLLNQLNVRVYEEVVLGRALLESSRQARDSAIRLAAGGVVSVLLIIVAVIVISSWTMGRVITERIGRLRQGAALIGRGDLDHRIDVRGDDELAELSGAFNAMAAKLQSSYLDLENEIGERKQAERSLTEQAAKLEEINRELESFSYSVSHDLRAPLRAISGFSRMIMKKEGDRFEEETKRQFQVIRDNVEKMENLIEDLLAFSRLGRQELTKVNLDMEELIREAWGELVTINPHRNMILKVASMASPQGDRPLIRQVYGNLLGNAVKFTKTQVDALIEAGSFVKDGEAVYYVRDNGVGFDMKFYDRLFSVFQRLHDLADYDGTGIGLALVQRIIHRHGGRIWATGEINKGATFYFTLPSKG